MLNSGPNYLLLLAGRTQPVPLPPEVINTVTDVQVTNDVEQGSGFQVTFRLDRKVRNDFDLLLDKLVEPFYQMRISFVIAGSLVTLAHGVITHHELVSADKDKPDQVDLVVMGREIGVMLDLEEKQGSFEGQNDGNIARSILGRYSHLGLKYTVVDTRDSASATDFVTRQLGTDLSFLRALAKRHGYIFYIEASDPVGHMAYFGPEDHLGPIQQPDMKYYVAGFSNVNSLRFTHNAFLPAESTVKYVGRGSKQSVTLVAAQSQLSPLSSNPTQRQRRLLHPGVGKDDLDAVQVALQATVEDTANSVTAEGQLDTIRYGACLRPNRRVKLLGEGNSYDGLYYVRSVTHSLKMRDRRYTQSFRLSRQGTGLLL